MLKYIVVSLIMIVVFVSSCVRDEVKDSMEDCPNVVVYDGEVQSILRTYCGYAGCHDGGSGRPSNFRDYAGMEGYLDEENFVIRVINVRDMPPEADVAEGFEELNEEDITLLTCWAQGGYLEN